MTATPKKQRDLSELSTFSFCPRRWYYAYRLRLRPKRERLPLTAGHIAHECAEQIHQGLEWRPKLKGWAAEQAAYVETGAPEGLELTFSAADVEEKAAVLEGCLSEYEAYHAEEGWAFVAPEFTFSWSVPGVRKTTLVGRIDGLAKDANGALWIIELKTTSQRWSHASAALSRQFAGYCAAIQAKYPVVGVMFRGLLLNRLRWKELKDGTPSRDRRANSDRDTLLEVIAITGANRTDYEHLLAGPDALPTRRDYLLQCEAYSYGPDDIGRFVAEDLRPLCKLIDGATAANHHPRNAGRMTCPMCSYQSICLAEFYGGDGQEIINEAYIVANSPRPYLEGEEGWEEVLADAEGS